MPFLLDTCTLWWLANKNDRDHLSPAARTVLSENADDLFVSAISGLEFGMKFAKGKFILDEKLSSEDWFREALKTYAISQVPINFQIATKSTQLPPFHRDPCDRIIVATAQEYDMKILTPDQMIRRYDENRCIW